MARKAMGVCLRVLKESNKSRFDGYSVRKSVLTGAYQMEPPSPIQALGVNPFPSRFIIRTVPRGDFTRRQWEEPITTTK